MAQIKIKVIFDRKNCVGAGSCCAICPKFWKMSEDGKADLLGAKKNSQTNNYELELEGSSKDLNCLQESAASCVAGVIKVIKEK